MEIAGTMILVVILLARAVLDLIVSPFAVIKERVKRPQDNGGRPAESAIGGLLREFQEKSKRPL